MRCSGGRRRAWRDVGPRDGVRSAKPPIARASESSERRIEDAILPLGGPPAALSTKLRRLFAAEQRSPVRAQRDPAWAGDRLRLAVLNARERSAPAGLLERKPCLGAPLPLESSGLSGLRPKACLSATLPHRFLWNWKRAPNEKDLAHDRGDCREPRDWRFC